jgi:glutamate synthase (NADPH/NADH) small chain
MWPNIFRVSSAHEEGGERHYAMATERFSGTPDGRVARLHATTVDTKEPVEFDADLVLLAMGFVGPERNGTIDALGIELTPRGTVARDRNWMTNVPGVFAAGDMQRGQSLIVWAIADGRSCARGVDAYLMGSSSLPAPVA